MLNTRKKGSTITAADFRDALSSFGLSDDKPAIDRLFKLYDWRNNGSVSFQVLNAVSKLVLWCDICLLDSAVPIVYTTVASGLSLRQCPASLNMRASIQGDPDYSQLGSTFHP